MKPGVTTTKEKIAYALGDVGFNFIWAFVSSFLMFYYTDVVGIAAGTVGTIMLTARLFDGVSDLGMGSLIEKTNTRWGKARPWILWGTAPLVISFLLVMNVPSGLSEQGKNIYVLLTYIFMMVICVTATNLPYLSLLSRISLDQHDRNVLSVIRTVSVLVVIVVVAVMTTRIVTFFGGGQSAWTRLSFIYASLALVLLTITFFGTKEKISVQGNGEEQQETQSLKQAIIANVKNKYFYMTALLFIVVFALGGVGQGSLIYYATHVLGNENLYGVILIIGFAPALIGMPLVPTLYKRVGKRNAMLAASFVSLSGPLVAWINPYSVVNIAICFFLIGLGRAPMSATLYTLVADLVDYGEWKYGIRTEGLAYSSASVGTKLGMGLGSAVIGWLLAWGRYVGTAEVQPESALRAMQVLFIWVPFALSIASIAILSFWKLDSVLPEIQDSLQKKYLNESAQLSSEKV